MEQYQDQVVISFSDADPAGVIFYPRLIKLAHDAVENLIRYSGLGWDAWFASSTHASPIRRAEADFFIPLTVGETFSRRAKVESIGESSVRFAVEFVSKSNQLAARIQTIHVLIAKSTGQPVSLTDKMRRSFEDHTD